MWFYTFYHVCEWDAKSAHTQRTLINDSFGVVKFYSLRGEGRRGWEGRVKNGVRMKQLNLVFVDIYVIYILVIKIILGQFVWKIRSYKFYCSFIDKSKSQNWNWLISVLLYTKLCKYKGFQASLFVLLLLASVKQASLTVCFAQYWTSKGETSLDLNW